MGVEEQIKDIEDELARTQYNKATQGHVGRLKAKLARLKEASGKKSGGAGLGYAVKKTGDATVILVGFPSVGKSTLLNQLTNADSKVAAYEFTTLTVVPGVLEFRGARIQTLDIPGIIEAAAAGKGRGKEVLSVIRNADLLIVLVAGETYQKQRDIIERELYAGGFRLNARPPDIRIARKSEGGIRVEKTKRVTLGAEAVREVLREFRILNGEILIREDVSIDQLVDCLAGNRIYLPALFIVNKADLLGDRKLPKDYVRISALRGQGIEHLKTLIWDRLLFKRIYLKKPGKEPDLEEPLIMRGPCTIRLVVKKFNFRFAFARIWGPSARFPGQKVGIDHSLQDTDIVEIHD
ncbi:MAG: GTP-binding protein [Candidatus Aenigmarchaeota archaeon]|nr:GTP-binding protein [Candidatus Aenigmarchaeota archaeon]